VLEGHIGSVSSVAISSDGTRIISGSDDTTIRIWDMYPRNLDNSNPLEDWELSSDGWVTTRDAQCLLWVPAELRSGLAWPRNTAVIYRYGSLRLNFDGTMMGERWKECYIDR
jgi:WD40 repeat protein